MIICTVMRRHEDAWLYVVTSHTVMTSWGQYSQSRQWMYFIVRLFACFTGTRNSAQCTGTALCRTAQCIIWIRTELHSAHMHYMNCTIQNCTVHRNCTVHSTELHSTKLHSTKLHITELHNAELHNAELHRYWTVHSTELHSAELHNAELHCAELHSAKQLHSVELRIELCRTTKCRKELSSAVHTVHMPVTTTYRFTAHTPALRGGDKFDCDVTFRPSSPSRSPRPARCWRDGDRRRLKALRVWWADPPRRRLRSIPSRTWCRAPTDQRVCRYTQSRQRRLSLRQLESLKNTKQKNKQYCKMCWKTQNISICW